MRLLLDRGVRIEITKKVYERAISSWPGQDEMIQLPRNGRGADLKDAEVNEADANQADRRAAEAKKGWLSYFLGR